MARLTRSEQTALTRTQLLTCAGEIFRAKGFHGANLDEIAEKAGFSKGVIYSQFGSKDDLFFALYEETIGVRGERVRKRLKDAPRGAALSELWWQAREDRRSDLAWELLVLEFRVHAARDAELNARLAAMHVRRLEALAQVFVVLAERIGRPLPCDPADLARFGSVLDAGGVLEELLEGPGSAFDLAREALQRVMSPSEGAEG